ncbi:MAG: hypothetical protein ACREBA_08640 [Nitrosotalea sp.]
MNRSKYFVEFGTKLKSQYKICLAEMKLVLSLLTVSVFALAGTSYAFAQTMQGGSMMHDK